MGKEKKKIGTTSYDSYKCGPLKKLFYPVVANKINSNSNKSPSGYLHPMQISEQKLVVAKQGGDYVMDTPLGLFRDLTVRPRRKRMNWKSSRRKSDHLLLFCDLDD